MRAKRPTGRGLLTPTQAAQLQAWLFAAGVCTADESRAVASALQHSMPAARAEAQHESASPAPARFSIPEACRITGLSRSALYDRVSRGLLKVIKDGHRTFIARAELERYLSACEAASPGSRFPGQP